MIKKFLPVIICFVLFHSIPALSQSSDNYDTQNYSSSGNDCTDYPALTKVENNVFGRNFRNENIYLRVNRLEGRLLGASFPQESLCDRIDRIYKVTSASDGLAGAENSIIRPSGDYSWQSMLSGCNSNSSYDNYGDSANSGSALMQLLNLLVTSFTSGSSGTSYSGENYYTSGYPQQINRSQNLNFGAGVRILP